MKLLLISIFTFLTFVIQAQKSEIKFGKVSIEEVTQKQHENDKDAEAAILFKNERFFYDYSSEDGFSTTREVHLRIKIYNKAGLDWATHIISLYNSSTGKQELFNVKGYTFNLVDGKLEEEKLKKDGIFNKNISKYRDQVSITMPNAKVGSVIDLKFDIASDMVGYMDDFNLQYAIPLDAVELSVEVPEYFVFKRFTKGFYTVSLKEFNHYNRSINYKYKSQKTRSGFVNGTRTANQNGVLNFKETHYEIKAENVPALKEVDFTNNIENYRSSVVFELESTKFPSAGYKIYSKSWEDVAATIYKYDDFGDELKRNKFFEDDLDLIIEKNKNKSELASEIFKYVQNRMSWDDYYGVGCNNGVKKAYEEKKGNVADINLLLTAMLRYAGFKANPVLVSTKSNGIPLFPTTNGFNYVVAAIENGEDFVLFDATEKMLAVNELPKRAMNWEGRLVREDGTSKEVSLKAKNISSRFIYMQVNITEDGEVEGDMNTRLSDNLAYEYRMDNYNKTEEEVLNASSLLFSNIAIDDFELKNAKSPDEPLEYSLSFTDDNQIEIIGDKLYFNPLLFLSLKENPFKLDSREYPVDFNFSFSNKINISYTIPKGYKIESIPEKMTIGLPDKIGMFNFVLMQNGNQLQVVSNTHIQEALIPAYYYPSLKEFYGQMVQKLTEKVVLSKI
ncbi:transglutaminase domain-containing protein [Maribacter hydrothermalis]|uniref:Transglutaminase-like domain-containing protein n=1 Tax=Maribacter hydrothermalis TaxID=1836467 RepID=A0A1B7ZDS5_9FLAO|nr:transglutaminase domain-containing protein [Maribacter hydrothermalis]APQ16604.1 hypothetical protein BTR34_04320 [Maribacter hydrothermalis]OBR41490.1 hypothetical protein A9200_12715 [Maribacter hydrothermalis]